MTKAQRRWATLAEELGFTFHPGVRGFMESKLGERLAKERGATRAQLEEATQSKFLMGVMNHVFLGVAIGNHGGFEHYVYRERNRSESHRYDVRLRLFFPEPAEMGLSIIREAFYHKIGKLFGAQDIQSGHSELDPMVMIRARVWERGRPLVEDPAVQEALLGLFRYSDDFEVDDHGIVHTSYRTSFVEAPELRELMDVMVEAGAAIEPKLQRDRDA